MNDTLVCCNETYIRRSDGWHYHWGEPVPGAQDLTLADLMLVDEDVDCADTLGTFRDLTQAERRWLSGDHGAINEVLLCQNANGRRPHAGDLIIGLLAPELHVQLMLTVGDLATAANVSKATIDSYRYRGYLPNPQVTQGRTPLWARPVISRWLATRPGPGWRTDLYDAQDADPAGFDTRTAAPTPALASSALARPPSGAPPAVAARSSRPHHAVSRTRPVRPGGSRSPARKARPVSAHNGRVALR